MLRFGLTPRVSRTVDKQQFLGRCASYNAETIDDLYHLCEKSHLNELEFRDFYRVSEDSALLASFAKSFPRGECSTTFQAMFVNFQRKTNGTLGVSAASLCFNTVFADGGEKWVPKEHIDRLSKFFLSDGQSRRSFDLNDWMAFWDFFRDAPEIELFNDYSLYTPVVHDFVKYQL